MRNIITTKTSVFVNKPPEIVWDFTQDYSKRTAWDKSVIETKVLEESPSKVVEIKARGGTVLTFRYKLETRPQKTSLAVEHTNSSFITGGGGAWYYEAEHNGTKWTQVNTIILNNSILGRIAKPILALFFQRSTKAAMQKAKQMMEVIQ